VIVNMHGRTTIKKKSHQIILFLERNLKKAIINLSLNVKT
jgi:hypothetical protein